MERRMVQGEREEEDLAAEIVLKLGTHFKGGSSFFH